MQYEFSAELRNCIYIYENQGGCPGLLVANCPYGVCRRKATVEKEYIYIGNLPMKTTTKEK